MHAKAMELLLQAIKEVAALPTERVMSAQLPERFVVSLESLEPSPPANPSEDQDHVFIGAQASSASHVTTNIGSVRHALASSSWTSKYSAANNPKGSVSSPQGHIIVGGSRDPPSPTAAQASGVTIGERFLSLETQPPSAALGPPLAPLSPSTDKLTPHRASGATEPLTAQVLVDGLLQYVYKVTEPLRLHSAAANAAARAGTDSAVLPPSPALPVGCPSLPSQPPKPNLPGKLDHATLVAYTVGNHS